MIRKMLVIVTLASFLLFEYGCTSLYPIPRAEMKGPMKEKIVKAVMSDGLVYEFPETVTDITMKSAWGSGAYIAGDTLVGVAQNGTIVHLPVNDISMVFVKRTNTAKTILSIIGVSAFIVVAAVAIIIATKESCPFIYSYDGAKYVFDGEPYGGSICEALERTDYCRLDHLKAVDGQYLLKLTNEVNETQYTDEFKLWVIDTPEDVRPVPDAVGNIHTIAQPLAPSSATDRHGNDISRWVNNNDDLFWEHDIRAYDSSTTSSLRDTVILRFPCPDHPPRGKLIVNVSNTLWASQMLRRDLELWGMNVRDWYAQLKNPSMRLLFDAWHKREEVFHLQVRVKTEDEWVTRGEILGGGPFATEERIVPLDLTGVRGDTLSLMITPPVGFWQMNSFSVDYSSEIPFDFQQISASSITSNTGELLHTMLDSTDHVYYSQPNVGDAAELMFQAPPPRSKYVRTIFAKVTGYYDIHLKSEGPMRSDERMKIAYEPGYFVKFALKEYWRSRSTN